MKEKVAFVCVHNSCRSQIAEVLGKSLVSEIFESYSAGTETKPQINQDAVRLMKEQYQIDMEETQYSKLLSDIPPVDIVITMGCNVNCPAIPCIIICGREKHEREELPCRFQAVLQLQFIYLPVSIHLKRNLNLPVSFWLPVSMSIR